MSKALKVYIGLGSNLGDSVRIIDQAIEMIGSQIGVVTKTSSYYETEPWGFQAKQNFVNAMVTIVSSMSPDRIINELLVIEKVMGRERAQTTSYESRILDLDIIAIENEVIKTDNLIVPHPKMHLRAFVLIPFAEIEPEWRHPLINKGLKELINLLNNDQTVNRLKR